MSALAHDDERHPHDIPRLGETAGFGSFLLRLVGLSGWTVTTRPALGGVLVIAHRPGHVIARRGAAVEDVAVPIFTEAMKQRASL